jgi:predicted nuclease of restriction endonuclease-like RecB superfamily
MLAAPLLRAIVRKGTIAPLFCTQEKEFELARRMIEEFKESNRNYEKKSKLNDRISAIESSYDDYKLVRGFYALLERRCTFSNSSTVVMDSENNKTKNAQKIDDKADIMRRAKSITTTPITNGPITIRRMLFEESSKRGFALTDFERNEIIKSVAEKLHVASSDDIVKAMWSDLEDNLIFNDFEPIDVQTLIGWYNLSLVQTLLFNSTKMDFYVAGGTNWKHVLRNVKRLGLMYYLENRTLPNRNSYDNNTATLVCSLEGPLSLFKLTDRYGTSIAKLLPSIIFSSDDWSIDAWVVRKTMMQGKKLYQFRMSSNNDEIPFLADPFYVKRNNDNSAYTRMTATTIRSTLSFSNYFDSIVEEKFARKFEEVVANVTGWKLIREPDPLIVSGGKAFIPDFVFEKYGKRVYMEIVGFWTPEYLERKLRKLADIIKTCSGVDAVVDLFIAINEELAASEKSLLSSGSSQSSAASTHSFSLIPKDKLIMYRGDVVPIKPILDHLKSLDKEMLEKKVSDPKSRIEFDYTKDVVSIKEISEKYDDLPLEVALKLALRDYGDRYIDSGNGYYLISQTKIKDLESQLTGITKFNEACLLLLKNGIPEACHPDIVTRLGYDVLWQSLDPDTALLVRRHIRTA